MRKIGIWVVIISFFFAIVGCGNVKNIDGVTYDTYGLINKSDKKNDKIEYKVIWGNVIWAVILMETIIAPIYFFGFSMFEPVAKLDPNKPKGSI